MFNSLLANSFWFMAHPVQLTFRRTFLPTYSRRLSFQ